MFVALVVNSLSSHVKQNAPSRPCVQYKMMKTRTKMKAKSYSNAVITRLGAVLQTTEPIIVQQTVYHIQTCHVSKEEHASAFLKGVDQAMCFENAQSLS